MAKFQDLTGQRFGKLVAICRDENKYRNGKPVTMWKCICDCGNEISVEANSLKTGNTRSCGCLSKEKKPSKAMDLSGKKFGKLTVVKRVEDYISPSGNHLTQWLCKCDCGNYKIAKTSYLMNGTTDNCGCTTFYKKSVSKTHDLSGKRFGKLTVIKREGTSKSGKATWLCKCDCGNEVVAIGRYLENGTTKSCGCMRIDDISGKRFGKLTAIKIDGKTNYGQITWLCRCDCGKYKSCARAYLRTADIPNCGCTKSEKSIIVTKHGMSYSKLYYKWSSMKSRCFNKNNNEYKNYGGRGITVCQEWADDEHGFENFAKWAFEAGWDENKDGRMQSIDRIDNDGDYEPCNCRFATQKEQMNNIRKNRIITYQGDTMTAKQWSEKLGINYSTLCGRLSRGLPIEKVFFNGRLNGKENYN